MDDGDGSTGGEDKYLSLKEDEKNANQSRRAREAPRIIYGANYSAWLLLVDEGVVPPCYLTNNTH